MPDTFRQHEDRGIRQMKICLVAHNAYGAMKGGQDGHIGGVERQAGLMSRWLAGRGHDVSLVTWEEGVASADEIIDGVRVIKLCRRDAGVPGLRFFIPRWSSLVRALGRADADLYYHNCAEYVTGQVALWCRQHRRQFIYSVASDPECDPEFPMLTTWRERWLYRYGLLHADRVIVQTERQRTMLASGFALESSVLPMPCEGPDEQSFEPPLPPGAAETRIVWIGRLAPVKRLEVLLDVAEKLPEIRFDVIGKSDADQAYVSPLLSRARSLRNVHILGPVAREKMPEVYRSASLLCCTSAYEGFPNTFLEAWSHGVPVVSTVDPDGLIASRKLGMAGSDADLAGGIRSLLGDPDLWRRASSASRRLYLERYSVNSAMPRFEALLVNPADGLSATDRLDSGNSVAGGNNNISGSTRTRH